MSIESKNIEIRKRYTIKEACELMGISRSCLYNYIRVGAIKEEHRTINGKKKPYIKGAQISAWLYWD